MPVDTWAQEIISLVEEIKAEEHNKDRFIHESESIESNTLELQKLLRGKTREQALEEYSKRVLDLLDRVDNVNQRIVYEFEEEAPAPVPQKSEVQSEAIEEASKKESFYISKKTRKRYLQELGIGEESIKRIITKKKKKTEELVDYTTYSPSTLGKIANLMFSGLTDYIVRKYSNYYANISHSLRASDIRVLSRTYISIQLFTSFVAFLGAVFVAIFVNFLIGTPLIFGLVSSFLAATVFSILVFAAFYLFPSSVVSSRNKKIKNDLPFMIIHMAAVAGSGAKPLSIFKLILSSGEYKGVEGEIKKIVNYVNLFGYDLSTALKTVASTTPSARFKDLLNGLVVTIESGGSLKSYLSSMADDAMNTYKLERKKYVEILATYSDIYTGILIAAPLLFIVTLAIINSLGGTIAGVSVQTIATVGTFGLIPFLNIAFLLFLNIIQPEV